MGHWSESILSWCLVLVLLPTLSFSQDVDTEPKPGFESDLAKEERLAYVMGHAKAMKGKFQKGERNVTPVETALLRWTNPYSNVKDGFLVAWTDDNHVPVAVGQIYLLPNSEDVWGIELQSLAGEAFTLASDTNGPWRPRKPGVHWKPVPNAPASKVDSKAIRLSQMRSIARRFRASDNFADEESELRLMTNPLLRYSNGEGILDGAVFAMVHGTDPEMILSIELRRDDKAGTNSYFYAVSPMTGYELRCRLDQQEVWSKPRTAATRDTDVFWQRNLSDAPRRSMFRQLFGF